MDEQSIHEILRKDQPLILSIINKMKTVAARSRIFISWNGNFIAEEREIDSFSARKDREKKVVVP